MSIMNWVKLFAVLFALPTFGLSVLIFLAIKPAKEVIKDLDSRFPRKENYETLDNKSASKINMEQYSTAVLEDGR